MLFQYKIFDSYKLLYPMKGIWNYSFGISEHYFWNYLKTYVQCTGKIFQVGNQIFGTSFRRFCTLVLKSLFSSIYKLETLQIIKNSKNMENFANFRRYSEFNHCLSPSIPIR